MIRDKIQKDIADEFANLQKSLQIHLKPNFDISPTKQFMQAHVPQEIVYKSEILLDTLINYLMEDARNRIKSADVKLQNAFFDADFRKSIDEWAKQPQNGLTLEPYIVKYTSDPRLKQSLIASGVTFAAGTSVAVTLAPSIVGTIVAGIITVLLSALVFKITYDKASPKAREIIKTDIEQYLEASQQQVSKWLEKVYAAFRNDFHAFCSTNGLASEEEIE